LAKGSKFTSACDVYSYGVVLQELGTDSALLREVAAGALRPNPLERKGARELLRLFDQNKKSMNVSS
jgi:hypothetical protein